MNYYHPTASYSVSPVRDSLQISMNMPMNVNMNSMPINQHPHQNITSMNTMNMNMNINNNATNNYLTAKGKFDAGRAFDFEDDAEFCPVLSDEEIQFTRLAMNSNHSSGNQSPVSNSPYSPYSNTTTPPHSSTNMTLTNSHDMNMNNYYQHMGSPVSRHSQLQQNPRGLVTRPSFNNGNGQYPTHNQPQQAVHYNQFSHEQNRQPPPPQPRALDIVDPVTGRVASPHMSFSTNMMPRY